MGSSVIGGGFSFTKISVGGVWMWTVKSMNIQGANQSFYVTDIGTPFGRLTDGIEVPIPGDVIQEMSSTLSQFQQQLYPKLALVSGQQTSFNITVTQGDPASTVGAINFMNIGAFGSFMSATAAPTVPWLFGSPPTVTGLDKNDSGQIALIINPASLTASPTPYIGQLNLIDNRVVPTIIPLSVSVTVLPQPAIAAAPLSLQFSYTLISGANSGSQQLVITNSGPSTSILNFTAAKVQNSSPWLTFFPVMAGGLQAGQTAVLTLSLISTFIPQVPGVYTETILVSSVNASNGSVAVSITLTVN